MELNDGRRASTSRRRDEDGNEVFEEEEVRLPRPNTSTAFLSS